MERNAGSQPSISVIIPARDASGELRCVLDALMEQSGAPAYEVIVVDDGSRDDTAAIAAAYAPRVVVRRNEASVGPGSARNRGVALASGSLLAFTDADCRPEPEWLARGLHALQATDIVQGRVVPDPSVARTPFDRTLSVDGDHGFYQTANLFVRRAAFDAVGGFRDWALERPRPRRWAVDRRRGRATRTPIGEDTLFAWRARRLGLTVSYAPDVVVRHAVVEGRLRDALADRWHWTRDMPGLVRQVPELRRAALFRRWFFADWSAGFDLAVLSVLGTAATRRGWWLLLALPYARRVAREASIYRHVPIPKSDRFRLAALHAVGAPVVDCVTLAGFIRGSIEWRSLVL